MTRLVLVLVERDIESIYCSGEKNGVEREARGNPSGRDGHLEHIDPSPQPANIKEFNEHIQAIPHEDISCGKNWRSRALHQRGRQRKVNAWGSSRQTPSRWDQEQKSSGGVLFPRQHTWEHEMIPLKFPGPGRWPSIAFCISSHKQASHIRQQKAKQSGSIISGIKGSKGRHLSIGSFNPNIVTKASSIIPLLSLSCGPCLPSRVPRYHNYTHSLEAEEVWVVSGCCAKVFKSEENFPRPEPPVLNTFLRMDLSQPRQEEWS